MKANVKVKANEAGLVVNVSPNNAEYGWIGLSEERATFEVGSTWVKRTTVHALITGKVEDLKSLGLTAGQLIEGRIQTIEQTEPFNEEFAERDLKKSGQSGVICRHEGASIYRKNFYDPTGESIDSLIQHTNYDEIKAAQAELESAQNESAELD